ncbi:MAG TPA: LysR family transcriptional regulator substrate-binding protein, partial [Candidatus Polarisedimenticolia bacterium]|nr:LysR family transcriptional regulator substrate-binding protein [Candidatus Polarisedimenticolia bacterium]
GRLHVGATFIVGRYVLPSPLFRFREQFADVDLLLHLDVHPDQLFRRLFASTLDLACYVRVATPSGLTVESIGNEELVVAAAPRHALARRRRISAQELSRYPFIASAVPAYREMVAARLREAGVAPQVAGHGQHQDALKRLVERDRGYSVLVRSAVAEELASTRLVALNLVGAPFQTDILVAYRAASGGSPLVRRFIDFIRGELAAARMPREAGRRRQSPGPLNAAEIRSTPARRKQSSP